MKRFYTLIVLFSLFALSACGKETLPQPNMQDEMFSWHNINANIINNRLIISGQVIGSKESLSSIVLEIQSIDSNCEACPFAVEFTQEFYANSIMDSKTNVFSISYNLLNTNKKEFRYRLIGKNYHFGINPIQSKIFLVNK